MTSTHYLEHKNRVERYFSPPPLLQVALEAGGKRHRGGHSSSCNVCQVTFWVIKQLPHFTQCVRESVKQFLLLLEIVVKRYYQGALRNNNAVSIYVLKDHCFMNHTFIQSSIRGHCGCFHVSATVNNAKRTSRHIYLYKQMFSIWEVDTQKRLLGHMAIPFLIF